MENLENVEFLYDISWDELEHIADLPAPAGKISYVMRNKMEQGVLALVMPMVCLGCLSDGERYKDLQQKALIKRQA